MNELVQLIDRGGWVMPVIITLSVVLYWRCFRLLFSLRGIRRQLKATTSQPDRHRLQVEARESFRSQRAAIGPMIAAAPLLGLLGTVSGMEKTFASLSAVAGERSMDGLAGGISEVLVATESGLTVAIPAMLLVYLAHHEVSRLAQQVNGLARRSGGGGGSA